MREIRATAGAHNTRFFYGPGRSRYQREDRDNAAGTGAVTTTHYVGPWRTGMFDGTRDVGARFIAP